MIATYTYTKKEITKQISKRAGVYVLSKSLQNKGFSTHKMKGPKILTRLKKDGEHILLAETKAPLIDALHFHLNKEQANEL